MTVKIRMSPFHDHQSVGLAMERACDFDELKKPVLETVSGMEASKVGS